MTEAELKALAERLVDPVAALVVDLVLARLERVRPTSLPERDVAAEIAEYLTEHPASTSTEIGLGIHVHRDRVARVLEADEGLQRVPAPPGRSARARCWALASEPVRQVETGRCGDEGGTA